jgi:hypothetical protein
MAMALTLTTAATVITLVNAQTTSKYTNGEEALRYAETGAENALLRLIRDPTYAGETLAIGTGSAIINISGTSPKTITSIGVSGAFRRTIQATATPSGNILTINTWSETP